MDPSQPETRPSHDYHEVQWTGETIHRFWEYFTLNEAAHAHHFSKIFGEAIFRVAKKYLNLSGTISLRQLLVRHGLEPLMVTALNFRDYAGKGLKRLEGWLRRALANFRRTPRWQPHLLAIGKRPE